MESKSSRLKNNKNINQRYKQAVQKSTKNKHYATQPDIFSTLNIRTALASKQHVSFRAAASTSSVIFY
jgi:hypothetical protein